jgi:flagellar biosynthesis GTPase FlhF
MMNGVRMPILIDGPNPNPGISGARQFTLSGARVPAPHGVPTFAGAQRPPNYQQMILEEQRRRLFEMETRRVREESERLARANALRLQQQQLEKQRAARELAAQTHLREQQRQRLEQQRQLSQQQRLREQQQREQQQRAQQQRAQQQRAQQQREQQEKERQQREKQLGQQFLQQLLRNQNAYVTQQTGQGHPNQRVFQVVMDNDGGNNPAQSQRRQRSPPRIIELPPDA